MRRNTLDQLCINYANEMLQTQFNESIFDYEQKLYDDERHEHCGDSDREARSSQVEQTAFLSGTLAFCQSDMSDRMTEQGCGQSFNAIQQWFVAIEIAAIVQSGASSPFAGQADLAALTSSS